jgi:hypothetical protein
LQASEAKNTRSSGVVARHHWTVRKWRGSRGLQLKILKAGTESEIHAAFTSLVHLHAGALLVGGNLLFFSQREQLVALAPESCCTPTTVHFET